MEGLQITATLKSSVIVGASAHMTLDGILGAVLFDQLQDVDAAHAAIPIKQTEGLFHASAIIVEPIDKGRTAFIAGLYPTHIPVVIAADRILSILPITRRAVSCFLFQIGFKMA